MNQVQAVLLAGGTGSRLGGADKALLEWRGRTLLDHWTSALSAHQVSGVVVGPELLGAHLPHDFRLTREDPPLSGPAAAVCAGMRALAGAEPDGARTPSPKPEDATQVVLLLAVDTVDPGPLLGWLLGWVSALQDTGEQALVPRDHRGQFQMLHSAVRRPWLVERINRMAPEEAVGQSMRWLLGPARTTHPLLPEGLGRDVDTVDDARRLDVSIPTEPPHI